MAKDVRLPVASIPFGIPPVTNAGYGVVDPEPEPLPLQVCGKAKDGSTKS